MGDGIKNARIESTTLGVEDHGIFTAWLHLTYGSGGGQGFGGFALDGKPTRRDAHSQRPGTAYGCEFILRVLRTLDAPSWEKLKGIPCRVDVRGGLIRRIGHLLDDKWFDPEALALEMSMDDGDPAHVR
jgi:hypothetical protein